jgi:hypothetical protein
MSLRRLRDGAAGPAERGPLNAIIPETLMIEPSPRAAIPGAAARISIVGATTFT